MTRPKSLKPGKNPGNPGPAALPSSGKDEGLEALKGMSLPPSPGVEVPGAANIPGVKIDIAPVSSGMVKQAYPFICDLLCHIFHKELMSTEEKAGLIDTLAPDLDAIDLKWLTPIMGNQVEAKVAALTGIAVLSRKNKPKQSQKPEKDPEEKPAEVEKPLPASGSVAGFVPPAAPVPPAGSPGQAV